MLATWSSLLATLALSTSAYAATCASLGAGASDAISGQFQIAAFDAAAGTTTDLHLVNFISEPGTSFHVLSVRTTSSIPSHSLTRR